VIALENLTKTYQAGGGVRNLNLIVRRGETLCLIGLSGCGKTTTLRMINRLTDPDAGRILIGGTDVCDIDPVALRRRIGYVIQTGGLFPHMTVGRNVGFLCELEGWSREETRARVHNLLALVNLDPDTISDRYPRKLSGGERQRVGIARAMALDPSFLLMDEPFGALDPLTRDQLHTEFLQWKERLGKTTILVTHDMEEAFALGDRVALMDQGSIVQTGTEETFRSSPANSFVSTFLRTHLTRNP